MYSFMRDPTIQAQGKHKQLRIFTWIPDFLTISYL